MSKRNVEIVRQIYEGVGRRDPEAVLALYHPDVELDFSHTGIAEFFEHSTFHGHEGLRSYDREWREAFENVETNCEELIDAGDQVISVARYRVRGRASGIELPGNPHAGVWTIGDGKVTRVVWFNTRAEALEAAGFEG